MKLLTCIFCLAMLTLTLPNLLASSKYPTYVITNKVLNELDSRIFGGFFEKATWGGEIGCDAAISLYDRKLMPEVKQYIDWMKVPIIRYPGGTDADYYPWYNLIDSMPGKHNQRPANLHFRNSGRKDISTSDGRMGLHEFISLCKELKTEPLIVVNLGDAYYKKLPVQQAAKELAADLVSYCNDKTGKWAELRAKNGSPEPFNVKYFQIGNETWLFRGFRNKERKTEDKLHYTNCIEIYILSMKNADPSIEIIIDGVEELNEEIMKKYGHLVNYNTFHFYTPQAITEVKRGEKALEKGQVSEEGIWQALVSIPTIEPTSGISVIKDAVLENSKTPIAMTEWNMNCWFTGNAAFAKPENYLMAYGIGAGSFLHAIMRVSDKVKIATQSMLVGTSWDISGIRIDTTEQFRPTMYPSAMVTGLYSRNHGNQLMDIEVKNAHYYRQTLTMSKIEAFEKVAEQDVLVTANKNYYFVHVINRSFSNNRIIVVQFPEKVKKKYSQFLLTNRSTGNLSNYANVEEITATNASRSTRLTIPAKSISVFKFSRFQ